MPLKPLPEENIKLFKSIFKGREDIFAIYWKKGNKSGFMPAYHFDPYMYRLHKIKGGTFKNYKDKSLLPLLDQQIEKHLNGKQLIGLYPLLKDNTSWFIAADFDGKNWKDEIKKLVDICQEYGLPAYPERSKSGNGGHVWIFFGQPYPAIKSRKILKHLLEEAGVFSVFDKNSSFDRLFPNQDSLSGKGFGNLMALPLYKPALDNGNSCFIDEQFHTYSDQWKFLSSVKKISTSHLDQIYESLFEQNYSPLVSSNFDSKTLQITLNNSVNIARSSVMPSLISFLREELNFANSEYFIKKKSGRNIWNTKPYFKLIEETEHAIIIPRGFIGKLLRFCKEQKIEYEFFDNRKKLEPVYFSIDVQLQEHQKAVLKAVSKKDFGVIAAPPGSGKTIVGLKIIAEKQQPALIVVHRKQLLEQWTKRIQAFLGIPKNEIGKIGQGKIRRGKAVTIAMIQSLGKYLERDEGTGICNSFGTIIIDECHHIPAESYRQAISKLRPYYQYGLTATPFRKGNDDRIIFTHIGEIIADIKPHEIENRKSARIIIRNTTLDVPFNTKTDQFETLSKILVHDSVRNKLILKDVTSELNKGKKVVIITERKEHIETLNQLLKQSFEIITLSGEDSDNSRKTKWKLLHEGNYQALITTGQLFGEGTDLQNASCLFLVYPFSFKGKLVQYIGRVQRSEVAPTIYDYRDHKIDYLNKLFLKRNTYYRKLEKQISLFDDQENNGPQQKDVQIIDKTIKVPIENLDFHYGIISFQYSMPDKPIQLDLEIEHNHIRPEFDVLKPYFVKILKSNKIEVGIYAEFQNNELVSQMATSDDLEMINAEILESMRFRFFDKKFLYGKYQPPTKNKLLDLGQLQEEQNNPSLYSSEEELLNDVLKNKEVKHYRQLRYLASKHYGHILKIRFVLQPFSFIFLLKGKDQFHIVLETLDTDEATYIWHTCLTVEQIRQDKATLSEKLTRIDNDLNLIKNKGRETFLANQPANFSRIFHDYSDERKGFIIWKDMLEERLV